MFKWPSNIYQLNWVSWLSYWLLIACHSYPEHPRGIGWNSSFCHSQLGAGAHRFSGLYAADFVNPIVPRGFKAQVFTGFYNGVKYKITTMTMTGCPSCHLNFSPPSIMLGYARSPKWFLAAAGQDCILDRNPSCNPPCQCTQSYKNSPSFTMG